MSEDLQLNRISQARWEALDIWMQLGNVSSEVGRCFAAKRKGAEDKAESAFWRGLELLDATISDAKNIRRGRELRRARELFCSVYFDSSEYHETPEGLEKYFHDFALEARKGK